MLPKCAVTALTRHIEHGKVDFGPLKSLDLEANCSCELLLLILLRLQVVDHGGFARVIEPDYYDLRLLLTNITHFSITKHI